MVSWGVASEPRTTVIATANKRLDVSAETPGRAAEVLEAAAGEMSTHAHGVIELSTTEAVGFSVDSRSGRFIGRRIAAIHVQRL